LRKYEIMVIVDAEADEETVGRVVERIKAILSEHQGEVGAVDQWGRRKLAYEIDRKAEGQYIVVPFQAEPSALAELDRVLSLADEVVRFKIVRTEAA
jgi:small subunit ribosomal protein S6